SIKDPVVNDFGSMLKNTRICAIYTNGRKADSLYQKLVYPYTGILSTVLPSTSPANARYSLEKLIKEWAVIREYLI
ncbi:MAG: DNA-deoxyinosine glycosylase, partial [Clostridiaceae bacterium]|nr:DNA-deoxyinosine glycosylase [Clostridiaceae bacterium]